MTYVRDPYDTDQPPCMCGNGPGQTTPEFCPACGDPSAPAPNPPGDDPMTHPKPQNMTADVLADIRERIPAGDSLEGNIAWAMPEDPDAPPRSFDVTGCYRVGNTMGQGGMRMIGEWGSDAPAEPESGHGLARRLIARHGTDRYPQVTAQALKVAAEVGELADAILKHQGSHDNCPRDQLFGAISECPQVRKEYADAGLALYELGSKLGVDLIGCMIEVVNGETRTFADTAPRPEVTR